MAGRAVAVANANIALSKYWGKVPGGKNGPAVPSLSVTLSGLTTRTEVEFDPALAGDALTLNGVEQGGIPLYRVRELLDRVRAASGTVSFARVDSRNDFPTASGLASSASGFAALTLAAARAAGLAWSASELSGLARQSSASAARSLFGGYVELPAGEAPLARPVATGEVLPLVVLVCVITEQAKDTSSTRGMLRTQAESPYFRPWIEEAPRIHEALRASLLAGDFDAVGRHAEKSALCMHASAMAAGICYLTDASWRVLRAVEEVRAGGVSAFATMDAGPHVKVLVRSADSASVGARLRAVPGVLRVLEAAVAGGPTVEGFARP